MPAAEMPPGANFPRRAPEAGAGAGGSARSPREAPSVGPGCAALA